MVNAVEFEKVTKAFGEVNAVKNISFEINQGQLVTLLGPSGCGKTTTLRLIAGLEMVTEGKITIGGKDVTQLSASDRDVSMVFQSYALFPHMTVLENVSYGLNMSRLLKSKVSEKALEGLELVGMSKFGDRYPSELSGGQQQRVAVARALINEPSIILADEPSGNLDTAASENLHQLFINLRKDFKYTFVIATHDISLAKKSDRILEIIDGKIK